MSSPRFPFLAAVYLILKHRNKALFLRRFKTGWRDGMYTLPAGHIDGNEKIVSAMAREAKEEIGVSIKTEDLHVVHVDHQLGDKEFFDFYLIADKWEGVPAIMEPDKCDDLKWFPLDDLPKTVLPSLKWALDQYRGKKIFSEFNWS